MISIKRKENCCGCSACASICPKHCISMKADNEGFLYPYVDNKLCVECGLCEKSCNELHPNEKHVPHKVLAAINKNEDVRKNSSSGGVFYILAEKTINEGGVVFGARFDSNWQVIIDYAEDMQGVEAFMGSKYVQARIENAYIDAKRFLTEGRIVLFSGTPCQIAGLQKFLHNSYENLLTVDFVCHGTPSPMVWEMYLNAVEKEYGQIKDIEFRNKSNGWKKYCLNFQFKNNVSVVTPHPEDPFMKAFLQDIILRPSCYACKAKGGSSNSDLTIADFWGIEKVFPELDDNKGTSMVFINTNKGQSFFDYEKIDYRSCDYLMVKDLNIACYCSAMEHPRRKRFFRSTNQKKDLLPLIAKCTKPTIKQQLWKLEAILLSPFKR